MNIPTSPTFLVRLLDDDYCYRCTIQQAVYLLQLGPSTFPEQQYQITWDNESNSVIVDGYYEGRATGDYGDNERMAWEEVLKDLLRVTRASVDEDRPDADYIVNFDQVY